MLSNRTRPDWNRRRVLKAAGALAATVGLGGLGAHSRAGVVREEPDYAPFKFGLQSYSLRGIGPGGKPDLALALEATKKLGLHYWESYPAHFPLTADSATIEATKRQFEAAGVTLAGYGVVHLGKDAAADARAFEFAKVCGIPYLSADPDSAPASLDAIDRLIEKFDVAVGIHNHGPGHQYAKIETIAGVIKNHHPKFGVCIDTGHFLRSKEDPVDAVAAFGSRVYGVHLKDVKNADTFTILGQGDLRLVDFLKALSANKYSYALSLEYEENPEHPVDDIAACLAAAGKAIAAVRGA